MVGSRYVKNCFEWLNKQQPLLNFEIKKTVTCFTILFRKWKYFINVFYGQGNLYFVFYVQITRETREYVTRPFYR